MQAQSQEELPTVHQAIHQKLPVPLQPQADVMQEEKYIDGKFALELLVVRHGEIGRQ